MDDNMDIVLDEHDIEEFDTHRKKKESMNILSCIQRCNTSDAKWICIYELFAKLNKEDNYDIGGCYTNDEPDLWFYFTTTMCPQEVYLLNLFVCHRKTGSFTIGISNSNEISHEPMSDPKSAKLQDTLTWYRFESSKKNQNHYVKTFSFNHLDVESLQNTILYIPLSIEMESKFCLSDELIHMIQLEHNTKDISSINKDTDFVIISTNGTKYPVHRIVASAHSNVLRKLINESDSSLTLELGDNEVELIIKYMYKGVVEDLKNQDINKLLDISQKYRFEPLSNMIKYLIEKQIDVTNAVEVAIIAKKYNLMSLQNKVFNFIKNNPEVLNTDGWKGLNDVQLAKSLFEYNQINI